MSTIITSQFPSSGAGSGATAHRLITAHGPIHATWEKTQAKGAITCKELVQDSISEATFGKAGAAGRAPGALSGPAGARVQLWGWRSRAELCLVLCPQGGQGLRVVPGCGRLP